MKKYFILLAALSLSACGFHLKGTYAYDHLPVQKWQVNGDALQQPLETALRHASGYPVSSVESDAEIRVLSIDSKRDIYTITRGAKLNEYLLSMRVTAQAFRDGQPWGNVLTANVRRVMPYSDREALGRDDEEALLWQEIRRDAAEQIVRQLGFINQQNTGGAAQ
ncbi:LPS assembly lipoprotein LptE [Wielerella bovis]|nr:LPS assembly lipoprotein LptE [Wielerella bovis]ULJ63838.1 LPS assembly lipoprotein LptE [Wielerella bovis]ULJ68229.1 LPS assembly lipoprotein LptE [Wielerella bovis]